MNKAKYAGLCLMAAMICSCAQKEQIFDTDKKDYIVLGNANWSFDDGEIIGDADTGSGFLVTKATYDNFELALDFNPESGVNSGIYIRCSDTLISSTNSVEINISDRHVDQDKRTGAIVHHAGPNRPVSSIGRWNSYKIVAKKGHIDVYLNDSLISRADEISVLRGAIALQARDSGKIRFKNIVLRPLK